MSSLLDERVTVVDGIAFADTATASAYRDRWEREASEDHVRSAIANAPGDASIEELLTAKMAPLWSRFPDGRHVGSLLDVGAGYGRVDLHLAREHGLTCDTLYAVDISETMLRRLLEYRESLELFPGAEAVAVCASADDLPLEDASVDLVVSSAVFLHMGKQFVARAISEIARVLKPGGDFIFDVSFPNKSNPSSWVPRLKPVRLRNPNALKYWTRPEVEKLLEESGLAARAGGYEVEAANYAVLPKRVGPLAVPGARRLNAALGTPRILPDFFAVTYNAYSPGALS
jgi:SAM-dependent methyltransferase